MSYDFPPQIEELVRQLMASGRYESEDALLVDALAALQRSQDDLVAVIEAIDDMEAGDSGRLLADVADEIRSSHGWSDR
jgi:Arc/MetJ-type ribon-helix-helix transcriptional regulator